MKKFISITRKVAVIILGSLILGIGIVVLYFASGQNATLYDSAQTNLHQQADILHQSIKNAMLPGEAPLVVSLFTDIQSSSLMYTIQLYRRNGVLAFSDDTTIETVNHNLGMPSFKPNVLHLIGDPIPPDDTYFQSAVSSLRRISFQHAAERKTFFTVYKPLLNLPKCTGCHGSDHTLRGVISIQTDMTPIFQEARNNILVASLIFIGIVILLFGILSSFLQRTIIAPIQCIGHVSAEVTKGNFREKVTVRSHDEIGELGAKINTMVDGLHERFELSKFVSTSTIDAIQHSEQGANTELTILFSDIRGFTSFSEKRVPEEVVQMLNAMLTLQTEIIQRNGGDIDKYVGDEIVALFTGERKEFNACRTALDIQAAIRGHQETFSGLKVGIGINTGEVILGIVGSERRADYTVIGDHVNFASRLCDEAQGGAILISASTYTPIRMRAEVAGPNELLVKGKTTLQPVYTLLNFRGDIE